VEIGLNPVATSQGTFVLACVSDISTRRAAELEARQHRNELTHLSRVAMLGELSGSLAHELNQPLTAILSNAEAAQRFLDRQPADLDEVRNILHDIVQDDNRAGEVIRRLRLLLKKGELQRNEIDINETVREVLKLVNSDLLNHNVAVETDLQFGLPAIQADRVQVQQVLLNLIVNGCDAMAHTDLHDRRLLVRTAPANGDGVEISIADRGCGIPPSMIEKVFAPFFTTKAHGMGLGLSVCRTIVAAHGGKLWATNNPHTGASFHMTLPCEAMEISK
jgi:C4-dicarboxylate-specific signal transduction histidine kinase